MVCVGPQARGSWTSPRSLPTSALLESSARQPHSSRQALLGVSSGERAPTGDEGRKGRRHTVRFVLLTLLTRVVGDPQPCAGPTARRRFGPLVGRRRRRSSRAARVWLVAVVAGSSPLLPSGGHRRVSSRRRVAGVRILDFQAFSGLLGASAVAMSRGVQGSRSGTRFSGQIALASCCAGLEHGVFWAGLSVVAAKRGYAKQPCTQLAGNILRKRRIVPVGCSSPFAVVVFVSLCLRLGGTCSEPTRRTREWRIAFAPCCIGRSLGDAWALLWLVPLMPVHRSWGGFLQTRTGQPF